MAIEVTKGQICDVTISKNTCHEEYYLCVKFHAFMKKCMIWLILGATPLYMMIDKHMVRYMGHIVTLFFSSVPLCGYVYLFMSSITVADCSNRVLFIKSSVP